jgi:hypothetical protein
MVGTTCLGALQGDGNRYDFEITCSPVGALVPCRSGIVKSSVPGQDDVHKGLVMGMYPLVFALHVRCYATICQS